MEKIQIFIDHDIIVRHFILNNTFAELEKAFEIQYVFPNNDNRVTTDISSLKLGSVKMIEVDRKRLAMLRQLAKIRSIKIARQKPSYAFVARTWKKLFGDDIFKDMWVRSQPLVYDIYRWHVLRKAGKYVELEQVIAEFQPDIIIHPTVLEGLFISDLALITGERRIPFLALMNSWDNPSTKAQIIRPPDWLTVWGEQTKRHAMEFVGMRPERIRIMGAAQFEAYRHPPSQSREEICRLIGVDPAKKLILYAGSSKSINEMEHLLHLQQAVTDGVLRDCQIIFRPHPWRTPAENEPDFYDIDWQHVSMDPTMKDCYIGPKTTAKMHLTSIEDTHSVLNAIDLLVSNMSTILLEAIIHHKPVICMISQKDEEENDFLNVTFNSLYFQELFTKGGVPRCHELANVGKYCAQQLQKSASPGFDQVMSGVASYFVTFGDQPYAVQLRDLVEEILRG
jgi:hypothetical protein